MSENRRYDREIATDILAVGGGGAGVMGAVAASEASVDVVLVMKGALGRSGNTIMAGGSFAMDGPSAVSYGYDGDPKFTKDEWFEEIVKQSFYLADQKIVETYVERAAPLVKQVVDWGRKAKQYFHFFKPGGFFTAGKSISLALRQGVKEHPDIKVIEDVVITDILTKDGRCVGGVGVDVYSGEIIVFKSKAVILGTGGFQPFSFKCTVSDMTGDGMGIVLRAGLSVADMEFLLFVPGVCLSPSLHRGSIFPFLYNILTATFPDLVAPRMKNAKGEDIGQKIPPDHLALAMGSEWMKLVFTYWWGKEIAAGNGSPNGGIYFSFDHVSGEEFIAGTKTLVSMMPIWYKTPWKFQGDDFSDMRDAVLAGEPWEVGLGHEYSNGGILVNEKTETKIPGFYAAGECSTGCFGAHRVHDALVEMLVQGYVAGEVASAYIKDAPEPVIDMAQVESHVERITAPLSRAKGVSPTEIQRLLEAAGDKGFGFVRNEDRMKAALADVERIRTEMIPKMAVKSKTRAYNQEWIESLGVENLVLCIESGLRTALMRKESHGTHIREDYPEVDHDNFLVRYCHTLVDGKLKQTTIKPNVTRMPLPTGKMANIMEYALSCEPKFKNAAGSSSAGVPV
ncbi:MAG: FAD-binding protein [Deltaproteobacteria bacterium]|nr:FAD-binding protein [Deltaproteobacteria bacterium]